MQLHASLTNERAWSVGRRSQFGLNWTRIAPNQQFIPLGEPGEFDSHTLYTAWSGEQLPLLNPTNASETMFYYAGGDGPHTGDRDDSIGLARATTHAYAGLRPATTILTSASDTAAATEAASATRRLVTEPIVDVSQFHQRAVLDKQLSPPLLSVLASGRVRVGLQLGEVR